MPLTDELLEEFGRWAASGLADSYTLLDSSLWLSVVEDGERWSVVVTGPELLSYLRRQGVEEGGRRVGPRSEADWADMSRRLSAAMSMWTGSGSVLRLNGRKASFEPEPGTHRSGTRPPGTPPPPGLGLMAVRRRPAAVSTSSSRQVGRAQRLGVAGRVRGTGAMALALALPLWSLAFVLVMAVAPTSFTSFDGIARLVWIVACVWFIVRSLVVGVYVGKMWLVVVGWYRLYRIPRSEIDEFVTRAYDGLITRGSDRNLFSSRVRSLGVSIAFDRVRFFNSIAMPNRIAKRVVDDLSSWAVVPAAVDAGGEIADQPLDPR